MATGIAQTGCVTRYVTAARGLIARWPRYDKTQRASHLINAAHAELTRFEVPNPTVGWENMTDDGQFDFATWQVKLSNAVWGQAFPNTTQQQQIAFKKQISELADTVYHECRHCEQWFRMARFLASKKTGSKRTYGKADISAMMQIQVQRAKNATHARKLTAEPTLWEQLCRRNFITWKDWEVPRPYRNIAVFGSS